ncbi:MAG TPA: hypothetical protein VGR28_08870 [Candidatus Thermoplasmatota archaeon]|nr:hypothetical protein [Candidatus Thermoplasmatota archaeon]
MRLLALLVALLALAPLAAAGPVDDANAALGSAGSPVTIGPLPGPPGVPSPPEPPEIFPGVPEEQASCGGTAPLMTACDASLSGAEGQTISVWVVLGTPFSGTAVATLTDFDGHFARVTCSTTLYVSAVTPFPDCSVDQSGELHAGALSLHGETQGITLGFWEVHASTE